VQFEWDERKNSENIRKHKIDFADVPEMFNNPVVIDLDDRIEYGESRYKAIGFLKDIIAVVIYIERNQNTIRIISARKATKYERESFESEIPH
jgi:uncharacterized DUF497 family protein